MDGHPIEAVLKQKLSETFTDPGSIRLLPVGGGSINKTYRLSAGNNTFFCKINSATKFPQLFQREKAGLQRLAAAGTIRTPEIVDCFEEDGRQFLLLEWVHEGERTDRFWQRFGERLAWLHRVTAEEHGLDEDNYMGSVPQLNRRHRQWTDFFWTERMAPLLKHCETKGLLDKNARHQFEILQTKLSFVFDEEPPSLLHGDLWSGNFLCSSASEPVLIDPAVYFGHRSMDLAMTTLFGGFRPPFYEAYHHHYPLPENYREQWDVCNLYPLLIHLYLFGPGYFPQIAQTLKRFS